MRILAFDTATSATTVALWDTRGKPLEARDDPPPGRRPGHTARLMPLIAEVLGRAGAGWEDLDRIAVGVGPGTFTGLRIGVAAARAMAQARGIELCGVSTLRSLALNALSRSAPADPGSVLAVLDARRGEAFVAGWRREALEEDSAHGEPFLAPRALSPSELAHEAGMKGEPSLAVGDGAIEFRAVLERSGAIVPRDELEVHRVTASNHCRIALGMSGSPPDRILPEYLRLPDAEITRRAAGQK